MWKHPFQGAIHGSSETINGHSGDEEVWKPGTKEMLDDMHLRKIDMADEIFVINVGGYIGESTKREIAYAEKTGKKVNYLEND